MQTNFFSRIKIKPLQVDVILLVTVVFLSVVGASLLASSFSTQDINIYYRSLFSHIGFGNVAGGFLAFVFAMLPLQKILEAKKIWLSIVGIPSLILAVCVLLAFVTGTTKLGVMNWFGGLPIRPKAANSAFRWITVGFSGSGFDFQPSELFKVAGVVFVANRVSEIKNNPTLQKFAKEFVWIAILGVLIAMQPETGNVFLGCLGILAALFAANVNKKQMFLLVMGLVGIFAILIFGASFIGQSYRANRIEAILTGENSAQIQKFQSAVASGGLFGKGYSNSDYKRGSLYESDTDGIFSIIGEENGFVGAVGLLLFYLIIAWRGLIIAENSRTNSGRALATGLTVILVFQAFWIIAAVIGLLPLKGVTLPFVSKGNMAMWVNYIQIGLLLNVSRFPKLKN